MEHNVILQAHDDLGNMHIWKYYTIKDYLINENHVHGNERWKFYKGNVNGDELEYSEEYPNLMRDVGDFQTYCRHNANRKYITTTTPLDILDKFLLGESENKRKFNYQAIQNGVKELNHQYNNGGSGLCEYRPGHIEGHDFFNSKGIEISWINEDADVCQGIVTRTMIFNRIKELIAQGEYCKDKAEIKPRILFYEDSRQLQGQLSIFDL